MPAEAGNGFGDLLRQYRQKAGLSQAALAQRVQVDQSYINRLERGEREPPRRPLVIQIATTLPLDEAEQQRLVLAAGHIPDWLLALGPDDPTLLSVARFLAAPAVSQQAKEEFRQVVQLLLRHWSASAAAQAQPSPTPDQGDRAHHG